MGWPHESGSQTAVSESGVLWVPTVGSGSTWLLTLKSPPLARGTGMNPV